TSVVARLPIAVVKPPVPAPPSLSLTWTLPAYEPGSAKTCCTSCPAADEPSPNDHRYDNVPWSAEPGSTESAWYWIVSPHSPALFGGVETSGFAFAITIGSMSSTFATAVFPEGSVTRSSAVYVPLSANTWWAIRPNAIPPSENRHLYVS